ncbi:O-glucosyltransferase rumi-like [Quillaja saponaria]|uniref:O-glucosyltransferase rumi-like n=1 Tax=Quillaja saponaria TaxID=32244 RepID=A0AAD7L3W1_QUISA|nr:O-glucosyltransferase rumi-like [Quillaja saponaria]
MKKDINTYLKLFWRGGAGLQRMPYWRLMTKKAASASSQSVLLILLFCFICSFCIFAGWIDVSIFSGISFPTQTLATFKRPNKPQEYPLRCMNGNQTKTCPRDYPITHNPINLDRSSNKITCPSYFKWIYEDLRPWRETGITRDMVDRARKTAHFRVVILNGKIYVEKFRNALQTRDVFTLWGILQLVRWYPGRLPDLEIMFDCDDRPVVQSKNFRRRPNAGPPPLFRYCSDEWSLDIVFPDWSFWGWAETNIKPWRNVLKDIQEGNKMTKWEDRVPYAYWRGNPNVASTRRDLMKCNVSKENDWNTLLYIQDWKREIKQGFNQSNLAEQCTHRYKIYIEGRGWSVSTKYILACNSMTLFVMPRYYDFFTRGMVPLQHYWPINRDNSKCASLKFAVEWGNNHTDMAQKIGNSASNFIQEDLKMDYVYDYMLHLLNEYAKLLRFKPTIPPGAVELCSERMACSANGLWRKFMEDSMVKSPSDFSPCSIPPPYDPSTLRDFLEKKANLTRQVQIWQHEQLQSENGTY